MNRWMLVLAAGLLGCPAQEPADDTGAPASDASVEDSDVSVGDTESEPGDSSDSAETDSAETDSAETDSAETDTSAPDSDSDAPADPLPDFALPDGNPTSASFGADLSPRAFAATGTVTAWYFTRGTCGYCRSQYVKLQEMQAELVADHPGLSIRLLSVNMVGSESGFDDLAAGGDLPVLQDTVEVNATTAWGALWRDVIVLDAENRPVEVYNLTTNDLHTAANYAHLRDLLVATASE